jgi:TPR repeat protein
MIQITRLLVKLYCFEIILFNTFAIGIHEPKVNADSVVNECNTGSECANFGYKYYIGEGVKQDDFKAVEFYQKACGLNYGGGCFNLGLLYSNGEGVKQDATALKSSCLTPLPLAYEIPRLEQPLPVFKPHAFWKNSTALQDDFKAVEFFQKACGLNYGGGCSNLGFSYDKGEGVKQLCRNTLRL